MARSKIRLVDYDKDDGENLTARLELENGEVVEGHFKVFCWVKSPTNGQKRRSKGCLCRLSLFTERLNRKKGYASSS